MEKLQLLSTFILLVISWSEQYVSGQGPSDVGLSFNGTIYQNNSLVNLEDIGLDDDALLCITANPACCSRTESPGAAILGQWFYPNGSAVADRIVDAQGDMWEFYRTRGPSIVLLNRRRGGVTGIYGCLIPDTLNTDQPLYVGLYTANAGAPSVTNLTFNDRFLTCTSTGGPATTVTWRRDGVVITPNATYQQTKRVIDNSTSIYQTVLTIDPSVGQNRIVGTYNCTVENARGESSTILVVAVLVSITAGGNLTLGHQYTLTCDVSVASGLGPPTVQWVGPGSSAPITTGGDFTVSSTSPYTLIINPLRQSHAGQYTCQATVGGDIGTASVMVEIAVPLLTVGAFITPPNDSFIAGQSYTLTCTATVTGGETLSTTITITWIHPSGSMTSGTGSSLDLSLNPLRVSDAGQYFCNVSVSSPFLTGAQSDNDTFAINVQGPSDVGLSLNGTIYQNNSLVNLEDVGEGDNALLCTTANTACCSRIESPGAAILGQWFYPNGSAVADRIVDAQGDMWEFYRTRGPSIVLLNRRRGGVTGIYGCLIPDTLNTDQPLYIGLYTANTGAPNVTNMTFIGQTATLTCTSTGGPATNVTWRRDGVVITPNATYQQTKRVIDNSTSTYQTVLTIDPSVDQSGILGTYNCTVENVRGLSSRTVVAVLGFMEGNPTLGQQYTLTCNVSTALGTPTVQWVGPGSSASIVTSGDFTVSSTPPYTLTINPLRQSHAGQYTCHATVGSDTGTASIMVDVAVPLLTVGASITPPTGPFTAGQSYTLTCTATVTGGGTLSTTTTITWTNPSGSVTSGTGSSLDLSLNSLQLSDAGQYTCNVSVSSPFLTGAQSSTDTFIVNVQVPSPTVEVSFVSPPTVAYAGNSFTLNCTIMLMEGITDSDLRVNSTWTRNGVMFTDGSRITVNETSSLSGITFFNMLVFSSLSTRDNGTYECVVTLSSPHEFVAGAMVSDSISLDVEVPTISLTLTANTTRLPNVAPYNTFSLTCAATSSVEGVGNVALPKRFLWRRRYTPSESTFYLLANNASINIVDGDNLNLPTSSSILEVTEDIPQNYWYCCQVDLDLPEDNISTRTDIYPVIVTGPAPPLQPSNLMSTGITHNRATIHWTVTRIAYTPETYTVHFGTSPDSVTPFSQQRPSGDNFTATNLSFSVQLTGLSAGTTYYYQVVAVNSVGSNQSDLLQFMTNELLPNPPEMFHIESMTTTSLNFSWQAPTVTNGMLTSYQVLCQPLIFDIPIPRTINPAPTEVTTLLDNLFPGVGYNCSIIARNRAGASDPTYTVGTTLETAVTSTPENFTVLPREQNLTFSWSPPTPTGRNGVITGYSLSCVPEAGGRNSITMQYTTAGTFTLGGFTPFTSYNCSISARNSQGSGPATHRVVTTLDDAMLFQLQLSGTGLRDCQEWVGIATSAKLNDIINGVVQDINQLCQCELSAERITESAFQCFENSEQQVTFRARLRGTGEASSSQLIAHFQTFVAQADSTIAVQGVRLDVDGSCSIVINSFGDPQCTTASPSVATPITTSDSTTTITPQSDNTAAIIGGVVAVVIAVTLVVTVAIIAIVAFVTKSRKRQFTIHQNVGKEPTELSYFATSGGEEITTTQCEAYELANISHEYEDLSVYQNAEYEIPVKECPAYVHATKPGD